jgi:hypothetical protein
MSAYNILIWSFQKWGIKFEMLNSGTGRVSETGGTEYTGRYEFQIRRGKIIDIVTPDPDTLDVTLKRWDGSSAVPQVFTFNLHEENSLSRLRELLG